MQTWIALFRGINVGGKNILPMAALVELMQSLKCKNVSTYIQSGNVVFDSASKNPATLSKRITARIQEQHGFGPHVLLISPKELKSAIESNPFRAATKDPKTLHFFFLDEPPISADKDSLEGAKSASESYKITDRVFYLHAPDGSGRSKLASNAEKYLGVVTTARNFRTVAKVSSMINEFS